VDLLLGGVIGGLSQGILYGLLGFATILLYKSTGVANFAVGTLATVSVFLAFKLIGEGWGLAASVVLALLASIVIGAVVYLVVMLPNSGAGHLNLTIRTFGVYLLAVAVLNSTWAEGQPFKFPSVFSSHPAFSLGGTTVSWNTVGATGVAAVLVLGFVLLFRFTGVGLLLLALAARPDVARLLGTRTRRLTLYAWIMSTVVGACVGLLVAPVSLLSSDMLDPYLLFGFSAAVIGGLMHLYGVFLVGALIGVLNNLAAVYANADVGTMLVFATLLAVLVVRPWGLFGQAPVERL
jgi:branched-chain amino acid transport system permease protein